MVQVPLPLSDQLQEGGNTCSESEERHYVKAFLDHPPEEDASNDESDFRDSNENMHPMLEERLVRKDILSIVVMERLGEMLPWGVKVSEATK